MLCFQTATQATLNGALNSTELHQTQGIRADLRLKPFGEAAAEGAAAEGTATEAHWSEACKAAGAGARGPEVWGAKVCVCGVRVLAVGVRLVSGCWCAFDPDNADHKGETQTEWWPGLLETNLKRYAGWLWQRGEWAQVGGLWQATG